MGRFVSVSSDWNIRDHHLGGGPSYFGRNIPTEILRSIFWGIRQKDLK